MARSGLTVGLTLAAILTGVVLAGSVSTVFADESAPKGQLTRRGLSGNVLANDGSSIVVETHFGNVTVGITNADISFPGPAPAEGEPDQVIQVGDRVGILLDRSPVAATTTPISISDFDTAGTSTPGGGGTATSTPPTTPPDPSFRTVEALKIKVIPSKATRSHVRGVLKEKSNGRIKILRGDGTEEDVEGAAGLKGEVGDDLLFVVKQGARGGTKSITNTASEDDIIDRIDRLAIAAEGNSKLADGLSKLRGNVNDKRLDRLEKLVDSSAAKDRALVNGAITKARGKSENAGRGNSPPGNSVDNAGASRAGAGSRPDIGGNSGEGSGNSGRGNATGGDRPDVAGSSDGRGPGAGAIGLGNTSDGNTGNQGQRASSPGNAGKSNNQGKGPKK